MDHLLIDANDRTRAKKVPLASPAFARMLRTVVPHRRIVITGVLVSIVYAMLHSVSILGALPILKVLLEEEGLHGWADRSMAGARTGLHLAVRDAGADDTAAPALVVVKTAADSELHAQGLRPGHQIVTLDGAPVPPREWLRRVASADGAQPIHFQTSTAGHQAGAESAVDYHVVPAGAAWQLRTAYRLTGLIPRDTTQSARITALKYVLTAVIILVIAANLCRFAGEYLVRLGVLRAMMDLRRALYKKVLRLPMSSFTRDTGDMVTRFVQDIQEVQRGLMSLFGKTLREPFKAAFILMAAFALDWRITLTMVVVGPPAMLLFWKTGTSIKKANKKLLRGFGAMLGVLSRTLNSINIVKAYTTENVERRRLWRVDRKMFRQHLKIIRLEAMISPLLEVLGVIVVSGVTLWLGSRVISRQIDPATFGSLVFILAMLFDPLRKLADVYTRIMRSAAGADRLFELLDAKEESELHAGTHVVESLQSEIEYRDVSFTYPEADQPALSRVSLTVRQGETVALVGRNGSGKTTLVNLLARFYDPQQGSILIDGVDLREITLRSLRKLIGLVTQETVVFPISLADNIAYGSRNGSLESVVDAARRAYADEFIRQTPQGYDTIPGEMGKTLSGGQRQRIAIARAILRDAPILIFDEATSQIDSESEQKIQAAVKQFAHDRTTIIIAHRLSTIRFADRIVVLEAGRIIDTGNHDELLQRCKLYHGLCETQLLG
ncbi:MAG: ABC transporter ATP-binding protein [Phycisphaerae bacterium]